MTYFLWAIPSWKKASHFWAIRVHIQIYPPTVLPKRKCCSGGDGACNYYIFQLLAGFQWHLTVVVIPLLQTPAQRPTECLIENILIIYQASVIIITLIAIYSKHPKKNLTSIGCGVHIHMRSWIIHMACSPSHMQSYSAKTSYSESLRDVPRFYYSSGLLYVVGPLVVIVCKTD